MSLFDSLTLCHSHTLSLSHFFNLSLSHSLPHCHSLTLSLSHCFTLSTTKKAHHPLHFRKRERSHGAPRGRELFPMREVPLQRRCDLSLSRPASPRCAGPLIGISHSLKSDSLPKAGKGLLAYSYCRVLSVRCFL